MERDGKGYKIEIWEEGHAAWESLRTFVTEREASPYVMVDDDENAPFFAAVAFSDQGEMIGYHICLVQPIGPEMEVSPIAMRDGTMLKEAKVRGLRVEKGWQNRGVGTALQLATLKEATRRNCFQMRSRSSLDCRENYHIKIKLGFACHPAIRRIGGGAKEEGVYWVKRLT